MWSFISWQSDLFKLLVYQWDVPSDVCRPSKSQPIHHLVPDNVQSNEPISYQTISVS